MSEFANVTREAMRMCAKFQLQMCKGCPLDYDNNRKDVNCARLREDYPEQYEKIVMDWAEKHPEKTILMDFKEKYPNAPLDGDGTPHLICPYKLGYEVKGDGPCTRSKNECVPCWNRPLSSLEGEGK
jgi:hypothetical protein